MTRNLREVVESSLPQGIDERIAYTVTTTPWGSSPTDVSVVLKTWSDLVDVSATNLSGSPSVNGDVITTPIVYGLTSGQYYRLEIKFTCSSNVFETWLFIIGEI